MVRNKERNVYISMLCKNRNIEGLKKELDIINRIIHSYAIDLVSTFDLKEKEKLNQEIENEKRVKARIEKCLQKILEEEKRQPKFKF